MVDAFTVARIVRLMSQFRESHGRDINEAELFEAHVTAPQVAHLVRSGLVDKYQVTNAKGGRENRYKVHKDWRSLNR